MLQQMVLTTVTKARQEKIGLAWLIVYTTHFVRAGPRFWECVPISPVLGLPFQKGGARVKFWVGRDKIWYGKIIYTTKFTRVTRAIFIRAVPKIFCSVNGALDSKISKFHSGVLTPDPLETDFTIHASTGKKIPAPTEAEMNNFYKELSKCKDSKPISLSLIPQFAESYVLQSRTIPTINDLFDKKCLDLTYLELLKVCHDVKVKLPKEQIKALERDTRSQSKGNNFFKHRSGRIGTTQSKAACQTHPAMPSQFLLLSICYPERNKLNTEAVRHGCKHEQDAINAYENAMKKEHVNLKGITHRFWETSLDSLDKTILLLETRLVQKMSPWENEIRLNETLFFFFIE